MVSDLMLATGAALPAIGLGTWKSADQLVYDAVIHAIGCGYRHIDCAPIYGNEQVIGRALNDCLNQQRVMREQLWVTSKLWCNSLAPEQVEPALKQTLSDLQLDYLDLYLIHWPIAFKHEVGLGIPESDDAFIPLDQLPLSATWAAMESLVAKGYVKQIGVSNFSPNKLTALLHDANIAPAVNQVECHPYLSQELLLTFCQTHGIHVTAYSPLASHDRPHHMRQQQEPALLDNAVILAIAESHRATAAQIILAWQLARGISVIPKSTTPSRIEENFGATALVLTDEDIAQINRLNLDFRYIDERICWGFNDSTTYRADGFWD